MSVGIVLIDGKGARITVFVVVQDDLFLDVGGTDQMSAGRIPTQREVIEFVGGASGLLPNSHTETAGYGRTSRIHDFRAVAVPGSVPLIDHPTVGYTLGVLGDKLELPEANDWGAVGVQIAIMAGEQYKRCISESACGLAGFLLRMDRRRGGLERGITASGARFGQCCVSIGGWSLGAGARRPGRGEE